MEIKKVNIMSRVHVSIPYGRRITVGGSTVHNDLSGRDTSDCHPLASISGLVSSLSAKANSADLGAVATSNDYNDLDNKPTFKTINGETITGTGNIEISGGGGGGFQTLTDSAAVTWDVDEGYTALWTLSDNRTFPTLVNHSAGDTVYLFVKQDATGSRTLDLSGLMSSGGITAELTATANAIDLLTFHIVEISETLYPVLVNFNPDLEIIA